MAIIKKLRDKLNSGNNNPFMDQSERGGGSFLGHSLAVQPKPSQQAAASSEAPGFESIYALQEVDPRSIKKLNQEGEEEDPVIPLSPEGEVRAQEDELERELNLGFAAEGRMESLRLREPIQRLGLSEAAEKQLLQQNKKVLKDLLAISKQKFSIGQGHIDEINQRLKGYLGEGGGYQARTVGYESLLHALFGDSPPLHAYVMLRPYSLEHIYPVGQADRASLQRMTAEEEKELQVQLHAKVVGRKESVLAAWKDIFQSFVIPWVRKKKGIASRKEVREYLCCLSVNEPQASAILHFLEDCLLADIDWSCHTLQACQDLGIFAADVESCSFYSMVIQKAKSYFYRRGLTYTFDELCGLLYREFARSWTHIPDGFVERALRLAPAYRVQPDESGQVRVFLR